MSTIEWPITHFQIVNEYSGESVLSSFTGEYDWIVWIGAPLDEQVPWETTLHIRAAAEDCLCRLEWSDVNTKELTKVTWFNANKQ